MGGKIVTKDEEKAEVLNASFPSVSKRQTSYPLGNQPSELVDRDRKKNRFHAIQEEVFGDLLYHVNTHRFVGPGWTHLRVLRELAEELAKPLSIILYQFWLITKIPAGDCPM